MHKVVFAAIAGSLIGLATVSSHAAEAGQSKVVAASSFAALDRNGDNRISRSEAGFDRLLSQTFAEIDTDGDGFVTPAEFAAAENTRAPITSVTSD